jgi:hypothetical protein
MSPLARTKLYYIVLVAKTTTNNCKRSTLMSLLEINIMAAVLWTALATIYNLLTDFKGISEAREVIWSFLNVFGLKKQYHWSMNILIFVINQIINVVMFIYWPAGFFSLAFFFVAVLIIAIAEELNSYEL